MVRATRTLIAVVGVSTILFAGLSIYHPYGALILTRTLSRTLHKLTYGWHSYRASLLNCNILDRNPDSYMVCLMPGYTLKQHKQTVADVRFDSLIESVLDFPDQVVYTARLDDNALAAIRADIGVDLVECDIVVPPPTDRREPDSK